MKDVYSVHRMKFTLIELLVCVAVIAILVALLMPALSRAKQRAREVVCINNLKNIAVAQQFYANESAGRLPEPYNPDLVYVTWGKRIKDLGYIGDDTVFYCPECPRQSSWDTLGVRSVGDGGKWGRLRFTYGLAGRGLDTGRFKRGLQLRKIENPSNHVLLADTSGLNTAPHRAQYYLFDAWHGAFLVHRGRAGTAFVDGAAGVLGQKELLLTEPWGTMVIPKFLFPE